VGTNGRVTTGSASSIDAKEARPFSGNTARHRRLATCVNRDSRRVRLRRSLSPVAMARRLSPTARARTAQRLDTALRQWTVPCDTSPSVSDPQQREPSAAIPQRSPREPSGTSAIGNASDSKDRSRVLSWFENRPQGASFAGRRGSLDFVAALAAGEPQPAVADPEPDEESIEPDLLPLPGGASDGSEIAPSEPGHADGSSASEPPEAVEVHRSEPWRSRT